LSVFGLVAFLGLLAACYRFLIANNMLGSVSKRVAHIIASIVVIAVLWSVPLVFSLSDSLVEQRETNIDLQSALALGDPLPEPVGVFDSTVLQFKPSIFINTASLDGGILVMSGETVIFVRSGKLVWAADVGESYETDLLSGSSSDWLVLSRKERGQGDTKAVRLDAETGEVLWSSDYDINSGASIVEDLLVHTEILEGDSNGREYGVRAINMSTNEVAWRLPGYTMRDSVQVGGVMQRGTGSIKAVDASGKVYSPTYSNSGVFVRRANEHFEEPMTLVRMENRDVLWEYQDPETFLSVSTPSDQRALTGKIFMGERLFVEHAAANITHRFLSEFEPQSGTLLVRYVIPESWFILNIDDDELLLRSSPIDHKDPRIESFLI